MHFNCDCTVSWFVFLYRDICFELNSLSNKEPIFHETIMLIIIEIEEHNTE